MGVAQDDKFHFTCILEMHEDTERTHSGVTTQEAELVNSAFIVIVASQSIKVSFYRFLNYLLI